MLGPGDGLFSAPSCPGSIVSAAAFHFRVRDENGWFHRALTTRTTYYRASAREPQAAPHARRRQVASLHRGAAPARRELRRSGLQSRDAKPARGRELAADAKRAEQVLRPVIGLVAGEGFEPPTFGL